MTHTQSIIYGEFDYIISVRVDLFVVYRGPWRHIIENIVHIQASRILKHSEVKN